MAAVVPSQHFQDLETRFNALKVKFLDPQLALEHANPLTFQVDTDQLAAFRLLVHAEFEEYLERKARDGLSAIQNKLSVRPFAVTSCAPLYPLGMYFGKPLVFECPFDLGRFQSSAEAVLKE